MSRKTSIHIIRCTLLTAILQTAVACATDDDRQPTGAAGLGTVAFTASMNAGSPATTRAANQINDDATLQAKSFGVFGCYTGLHKYVDSNIRPDFMYNEKVTYSTGQWEYSPLKYWPNGEGEATGNTGENPHYVSFMAYAPWSNHLTPDPENEPADYCIPSFSHQGELGNPWLTYRLHTDVEKQVDLLYAPAQLDQKKPTTDYRIPFAFNQALACVGDRVTISCSNGLKGQTDSRVVGTVTNAKIEVTGFEIEYTLTSKARLILWNNGLPDCAPYWQTILSEAPVCKRTVTLIDPNSNTDNTPIYAYSKTIPSDFETQDTWEGLGVFYIPIELAGYVQTAKVSLTYRIATYSGSKWTYDSENAGSATLTLHDYSAAFQAGRHLYINVTLNQMDIALTAAIAPWQTTTPQEVEGVED